MTSLAPPRPAFGSRLVDLEEILGDPPKIHDWGTPAPISSGLPREAYEHVSEKIRDGACTLETGTGISTVLFACKRTHHICIAPDPVENQRLKEYCAKKGVSLDRVKFFLERSERVLVNLETDPLDLVLIDGGHGFPVAFLDFYFTASKLTVGGTLVIDDIQLWTGRVLTEFLQTEPEWELEAVFSNKTAFFIKRSSYDPGKEWVDQPFVVRRSAGTRRFGRLRRVLGYLVRGDVKTIGRKIAEKVRAR